MGYLSKKYKENQMSLQAYSVWTKDQCKKWLEKEIVNGGTTSEEFWSRIYLWHAEQYTNNASPYGAANAANEQRADKCVLVMEETAKEMGLEPYPVGVNVAGKVFKAEKVIAPPPVPIKKSLFDRIRENDK